MKLKVPGDKSLSQRALILAALGDGDSRLRGLLPAGDAASTAGALRALGVDIAPLPAGGEEVRIRGAGLGGLAQPAGPLDLGNSGTGARLLMGVLAGSPLRAHLTGDASLCARPMRRVTEPLAAMGARFVEEGPPGRLPLTVEGSHPLRPLDWPSPVASAQVKSAILLAACTGAAWVQVTEPRMSRDHTERLLRHLGVTVHGHPVPGGWRVELREPPERLRPLDFDVPGDISSAAFLLTLAALGGAGREGVEIADVGLNDTRTAFLDVLRRMGAPVAVAREPAGDPEPRGTVAAAPGELTGTTVDADDVPALIDELPLVAMLGARAKGETTVRGAAELRHKESDRIALLVENLRGLGLDVEEYPDGFALEGTDGPLQGRIRTAGDHRIAMAFGVLGATEGVSLAVDDPDAADVSFPGFWEILQRATGREG